MLDSSGNVIFEQALYKGGKFFSPTMILDILGGFKVEIQRE